MRVFISYRRQDTAPLVDRLYQTLTQAFGAANVFRDLDSIQLGTDFRDAVRHAIDKAEVTLAVIGPHWVGFLSEGKRRLDEPNDLVRLEVEAALKGGKFVVPLLAPGGVIPAAGELPESLRDLAYRNGMPLRNDPDFTPDTARLIKSLRELKSSTDPTAPPAAAIPLRTRPYTITRDGERHVIYFAGSFVDSDTVTRVRQELVEYLQQNNVRHLTLNMKGIHYLSSSMLAVFLRLFRHVQTVGGDMLTTEVPATLAELLRITRIDKILGLPPDD
jgi:anti-anti-sigma factor